MKKVVALAGGVGGAKLARGLARVLPNENLSLIVNTGDDFDHFGLHICPDLDTVMYNLAGNFNELTGWGRKDETWTCFSELEKMNSETWFRLGDRDLATHLERNRLLLSGKSLTEVTAMLCKENHIANDIFPMTDDFVPTIITTEEYGDIPFQEYFVKYHFEPKMLDYHYQDIKNAKLNPQTRHALKECDLVIFCPSNPWLSIFPILAVTEISEIIGKKTCVAVSPIVGKQAIKGPAAKIFTEKGTVPSAKEVARLYRGIIKGFVLDQQNSDESEEINGWGIISLVTDTIMTDDLSKERLAREVFEFASKL
jgi:LPPG:FO 2-phospho-L-lactate transferase